MKKRTVFATILLAMFLVLAILFAGCTLFQGLSDYAATETGKLVLQEAGEIAGTIVGFEDQSKIEEHIQYCDNLLKQKDEGLKKAALELAYTYVYTKYGQNVQTALLLSKATKLLGLIVKDEQINFLEGYDLAGIDLFIKAFRDGLTLATPRFAPRYLK